MSEYDYNRSSESCGIRPALRIRCSWMELLQLIQSDPDRYAFFDGSTNTAYHSEYLQAYAAAAEADQLKRYRRAMTLLERGEYDEASDMFAGLGDYQESARMVTECAYQKALRMVENGREEEAVAALEALNGYSDSSNQIELAKERIRGKRYAAAEQLEKEGRYAEAYDIFADADMEAFGDSPARAAVVADKAAEQKRQKDYADAAELYASGKLEEAEAIYQALGDYRDSAAKLAETQNAIRTRDYAAAKEALEKADFARAVELLSNLGDYQDSRTLLAEVQTGLSLIYDQALANAYAGKLTEAYQGFTTLGSFRDSAKKAEIVGNLSRAGKTQKLAEGVLIYEFHGLWGIANMNTNVITPVKYTSITFEQNSRYAGLGLAKVYISGGEPYSSRYIHALDTYGYINMDGEEVIPCSYLFITDFNTAKQCTVAKLKEDASGSYYYNRVLFGIIDSQGNTVTGTQWRTMGESANLDWYDSDQANQWYASDFTVSSPSFTDGRMKVQNPDGLWGFIDGQGKVLGEVKWKEIGNFSDGMAKVSQDVSIGSGYSKKTVTRYGFINEQGQTIGEVRWEAVNNFSQGLAAVKEDGKWGFIDRTNTLVIPCRYTEVNAFKADGTCDVRNPDGTWIVIDKKGDSVFFGN